MSRITLRQLHAFVAVAETGKFRLAAEAVNLTQSAVSVLIKDLEALVGVQLFDRHTRFVGLTDAGQRLLPLAKDILDRVEAVDLTMSDISTLRTGRVCVASAVVLAATYLPGLIASFMQRHPQIRVDLRDVSEDAIRELLLSGEADIGVGTSRFLEQEINERVLFVDHLAVFCPASDPLAAKATIAWTDLANRKFIVLSPENPLQRRIDALLETNGVKTVPNLSVHFSTTMLALVNEGLGICILPAGSQRLAATSDIVMRPLADPSIEREVVALTPRERSLSPAARSFLHHITSEPRAPDAKP